MIGEIVASYKDQLNENEWMEDQLRKVSIEKNAV